MISDRLKKVILCQLRLSEFNFTDQMFAYQVPGWDSLTHAVILTAIEKEYGVHFKTIEILQLQNLGDLQALVDSKLSKTK